MLILFMSGNTTLLLWLTILLYVSGFNPQHFLLPEMIRSATPFPLVSLFFMFIGFVLNNIGHIRPHRTILAFVSGIFFILSGTLIVMFLSSLFVLVCSSIFFFSSLCVLGLALVVGLVLYISSINDEMLNRPKSSDAYFTYKYGWSFAFAAISFLLTEVSNKIYQSVHILFFEALISYMFSDKLQNL